MEATVAILIVTSAENIKKNSEGELLGSHFPCQAEITLQTILTSNGNFRTNVYIYMCVCVCVCVCVYKTSRRN